MERKETEAARMLRLQREAQGEGLSLRRRVLICVAGIGGAVLLGLALFSIEPPAPVAPAIETAAVSIAPAAEPSPSVSEAELEQARLSAEADFPPTVLPSGAPDAPLNLVCSTKMCAAQKVVFRNRDWPAAWKGDYQGQRNAGFCRSRGCDGAVVVDKAEGCAWRIVIIAGNAVKSGDTDTANLKAECGQMDDVERQTAMLKAQAIFEQIYHRPLP